MNAQAKIKKLLRKGYRDAYMQTTVRAGIAYQIQALRGSLSQTEFAKKIGKHQSDVSKLENEEQGQVSVQTLLDIASALDIALLVRFVDYAKFLDQTEDKSSAALAVETVSQTAARLEAEIVTAPRHADVYSVPATGIYAFEIGVPATWSKQLPTNPWPSELETPSGPAHLIFGTSMPTSALEISAPSTSR